MENAQLDSKKGSEVPQKIKGVMLEAGKLAQDAADVEGDWSE